MRSGFGVRVILVVAALTAGIQSHQVTGQSQAPGGDTVKIVSISPGTEASLRVGAKVLFKVKVAYSLTSASSGVITLVIQQGESGHRPLANETAVVQKGSGTLDLTKEVVVPDTRAIQVFTPLSVQSGTSTSVVDIRSYAVAKD